ncbi:MAG TPA: hypothetical protein VND96_01545 [Candidatus Micrarchaeaceae archaeon]|nr:hypothetical protein [Candidatus Micrarchaeaceae archaeon]
MRLDELVNAYDRQIGNPWYQGRPCLDDSDSVHIRDDIARRNRELKTLLEVGGTLVLFLPAPASWFVSTGERQFSGTGRNRQTTRIVNEMQLLSLLPFDIHTEAAESRDLDLRVSEPFATFWRTNARRFQTAAILKESIGEKTLVISGTESVAGSIARFAKGLVIMLPQDLLYPADYEVQEVNEDEIEPHPDDITLIDSMFDLVRDLRKDAGDYIQPEWAAEYHLPGEVELAARVRQTGDAVRKAQIRLDAAERALAILKQRKTLFTGSGAAFEAFAEEAFKALGFAIEEGRPGRTDRIVRLHGDTAVMELKGRAKSAAEKDAAQLEKWVSEHFVDHGSQPKGILVVNGWRDAPLQRRTEDVFPDQMLEFSEARKHCLISGIQLLGAWLDAEEHPEMRDHIARSIMSCIGRYEKYREWTAFLSAEGKRVQAVDQPST